MGRWHLAPLGGGRVRGPFLLQMRANSRGGSEWEWNRQQEPQRDPDKGQYGIDRNGYPGSGR